MFPYGITEDNKPLRFPMCACNFERWKMEAWFFWLMVDESIKVKVMANLP